MVDATIKTDASGPKPPRFRPERSAPSMVAGRPVWVQSPAKNRLRQRVSAGGRLASCSGVAAKVARFSLTICHVGMRRGDLQRLGDISPDMRGQLVAVLVHDGVGARHRDRDAVGKREDPFRRAADHPQHGGRACRRGDPEMGIDDGAEIIGHGEVRDQVGRRPGRHRQDHHVTGCDAARCASPVSTRQNGLRRHACRPRTRASKRTAAPLLFRNLSAGSTKAAAKVGWAMRGR